MAILKKYRNFFLVLFGLLAAGAGFFVWQGSRHTDTHSLTDPLPALQEIVDPELGLHPRLRGLANWRRPEGPFRVALQVGHYKAAEAPEEQINLRQTTGTNGGGKSEWEVGLAIALETKALLEAQGVQVEILPTTIPPNYWADVFVSIHADGNENSSISGYKVAGSRLDQTGRASDLVRFLEEEYRQATALPQGANITRSMRGYYAFNWRRYEHSLHPMTVAAIIETGFLTSPRDRQIIVNAPEKPAAGIARGILKFLEG